MTDDSEPGLDSITGVGQDSASALRDAGFETVADVANAQLDAVADVSGFGESRAADAIDAAQELTGDSTGDGADTSNTESGTDTSTESDTDTDTNVGDNTDDADQTADDDSAGDRPTYDITFSDAQVHYHVLHVVLEEATSCHQSSALTLRDASYRVADKLMSSFPGGADQTVSFTKTELSALYRALNSGATDYASRGGTSDLYSELEAIKRDVNDRRREAMGSA